MPDWTQDATDYLEGYLEQVAALAHDQGDDADDIVNGLRDHISREVDNITTETVGIDVLSDVLATIGTPKEVANLDTPLQGPRRPAGQKRGPWYRSLSGCALAAIIALAAIPIIMGTLALGMFFFLAAENIPEDTVDPAKQLAACKDNLMTVDNSLREYANEHDQFFPPLSKQRGRLMFTPDALYPDYMDTLKVFFCPPSKFHGALKLQDNAIDDHTYFYMNHILRNEEEGLAYLEAYRNAAEAGNGFDFDLTAADGSAIPRILSGLTADSRRPDAGNIPVMIEKPVNHESPGGHVLFLDGHVEFMNLGESFPMTESFIHALESIDD